MFKISFTVNEISQLTIALGNGVGALEVLQMCSDEKLTDSQIDGIRNIKDKLVAAADLIQRRLLEAKI